jgi:hypothetical protein
MYYDYYFYAQEKEHYIAPTAHIEVAFLWQTEFPSTTRVIASKFGAIQPCSRS